MSNSQHQQEEKFPCPVCETLTSTDFVSIPQQQQQLPPRIFFACQKCKCVFLPHTRHLNEQDEKARYDTHNNDPDTEGYQNFLNQSLKPLSIYLSLKLLNKDQQKEEKKNDLDLEKILETEDDDYNSQQQQQTTTSAAAAGGENSNNKNNNIIARHFAAPKLSKKEKKAKKEQQQQQQQQKEEEAEKQQQEPELSLDQKLVLEASSVFASLQQRKKEKEEGEEKQGDGFVGLDFGCGPHPALQLMIQKKLPFVTKSEIYDKYYHDDESVFFYQEDEEEQQEQEKEQQRELPVRRSRDRNGEKAGKEQEEEEEEGEGEGKKSKKKPREFDFITSTEVVEHLRSAGSIIKNLWKNHLKSNGGVLVIQTSRTDTSCPIRKDQQQENNANNNNNINICDPDLFKSWWYIRDQTHVTLFHTDTFRYLKKELGAKAMLLCGPTVVMFVK